MENETDKMFTWVITNLLPLKTEYEYTSACTETTTMGNEADNKLSWVIQKNPNCISSEYFLLGGCKWYLMLRAQGDYLSLFLGVACIPAPGWIILARYRLTVVNQLSEKLSIVQDIQCWFDEKTDCMNYPEMIPFTQLSDENGGFFVNNQVKILVEIDVLEAFGVPKVSPVETQPQKKRKLDTESIDVNGFQLLPSQAEFVSCVFKKYPDIAVQLRARNEPVRTSCLYVFVGLIETLCKSLDELSNDNLVEAENALTYLKISGFKVDWLEKKVDEVKENKKEEQIGLARTQEVEETLNIFKQKCSDKKALVEKAKVELKDLKQKCSVIEAQLEKEKAKVLATRAPSITLDDAI